MSAKSHKRRTKHQRQLIEIVRHISGPPRRAPGQTLWMTRDQIKSQRLVKGQDYIIPGSKAPPPEVTPEVTPEVAPEATQQDDDMTETPDTHDTHDGHDGQDQQDEQDQENKGEVTDRAIKQPPRTN